MRMSVIALGICLAGGGLAVGPAAVALRPLPHAIAHSGPAGSPLEAQVLDPQLGMRAQTDPTVQYLARRSGRQVQLAASLAA